MNTTEMTPEQIRVRCAEIEGILLSTKVRWSPFGDGPFESQEWTKNGQTTICPDYTNSIDAINAAVLRMSPIKQTHWALELSKRIPVDDIDDFGKVVLSVAAASALERAKAFVSIHQP